MIATPVITTANLIALCIALNIVRSTYFENPVWQVMQNAILFA